MRGEVSRGAAAVRPGAGRGRGDPALTDLRLLLQINQAVALGDLDRYDDAITAARAGAASSRTAPATWSGSRRRRGSSGELLFDVGRWDEALAEIGRRSGRSQGPGRRVAAITASPPSSGSTGRGGRGAPPPRRRRPVRGADRQPGRLLARARPQPRARAGRRDRQAALAVLMAGSPATAEEIEEIGDLLRRRRAARRRRSATPRPPPTSPVTRRGSLSAADVPHRPRGRAALPWTARPRPRLLLRAAEGYRDAGRPLPRAKALEAAARRVRRRRRHRGRRGPRSPTPSISTTRSAPRGTSPALQARFRAYGIRRGPRVKHRQARRGWDSLTPTESKIAQLVAQGMSNPQIAAALFLSPRTVATHVSHILTKLDVHSRIDIAREAGRRYSASG